MEEDHLDRRDRHHRRVSRPSRLHHRHRTLGRRVKVGGLGQQPHLPSPVGQIVGAQVLGGYGSGLGGHARSGVAAIYQTALHPKQIAQALDGLLTNDF